MQDHHKKSIIHHTFTIVVAINKHHEIGSDNAMVSDDNIIAFMKKTYNVTSNFKNVIILGHQAFQLLTDKYKSLICDNIIVCINNKKAPSNKISQFTPKQLNCYFCPSFNKALKLANSYVTETYKLHDITPTIFVGGGAHVYRQAIEHPLCAKVIISIKLDYPEIKDATAKHFPRVDLSSSTIHGKPTQITKIGPECISYVYDITNIHLHDYCQALTKLINQQTNQLNSHKLLNQMLRFQLCDNSNRMVLPLSTVHGFVESDVHAIYSNLMHIIGGKSSAINIMPIKMNNNGETGFKLQVAHHLHKYLCDLGQLQHTINLFRARLSDSANIVLAGPSATDLINYRYPVIVLTVTKNHNEEPTYLNMNVTGRSVELFYEFNESLIMFSLLAHLIAGLCNLRAHELVFNIAETHISPEAIPEAKQILTNLEMKCNGYPYITFCPELLEAVSLGSVNDVIEDCIGDKKDSRIDIKVSNFYGC